MGIDIEREWIEKDRNRKILITIIIIGVILCLVIPGTAAGIFALDRANQQDTILAEAQVELQNLQKELDVTRNQLVLAQSDLVALEDEYNQLQSNYDTLINRYDSVSQDYEALKTATEITQGKLSASQTALKDQQAEIEILQSQNGALTKTITRARAYADLLYSTLSPQLQGERLTTSDSQELFDEWNDKLKTIDDPTLDEKYSAWVDSDLLKKQFDDFLFYLIRTLFNTLK